MILVARTSLKKNLCPKLGLRDLTSDTSLRPEIAHEGLISDIQERFSTKRSNILKEKPVLRMRIRCLFDPRIWDPGWVKNQDPDLGSWMEKIWFRDPGETSRIRNTGKNLTN
jgi:hypothetical protein